MKPKIVTKNMRIDLHRKMVRDGLGLRDFVRVTGIHFTPAKHMLYTKEGPEQTCEVDHYDYMKAKEWLNKTE